MTLTAELREQLVNLSAATIDRLLAPFRGGGGRRPVTTTDSVSALKKCIPIRTCADRKYEGVGHMEVDLAAHCGASGEGFFLNPLVAVAVATSWTECIPVWGKGQARVGSAIYQMRGPLPFPLLGLHSDNGSEFINHHLWSYCQQQRIDFSRSRSYKKNDQAHVEQKNWSTGGAWSAMSVTPARRLTVSSSTSTLWSGCILTSFSPSADWSPESGRGPECTNSMTGHRYPISGSSLARRQAHPRPRNSRCSTRASIHLSCVAALMPPCASYGVWPSLIPEPRPRLRRWRNSTSRQRAHGSTLN